MIRTVPLTTVQAAVYKTLNDNLTGYPIMDDSTPFESGKLPGEEFVIIGSITAVPQGTKANTALWETTATLDVYSSYKGKKRVNEIVDEIVTVLTGVAENGSFPLEGYSLIMLNIESVEARAEDWNDDEVWQHGIVRVAITVEQNKY